MSPLEDDLEMFRRCSGEVNTWLKKRDSPTETNCLEVESYLRECMLEWKRKSVLNNRRIQKGKQTLKTW